MGATLAICLVFAAAAPAAEAPSVVLKEDVAAKAELDLDRNDLAAFQIAVPPDAVLMTARVSNSPAPLDILARFDQPIASSRDAEHGSEPDALEPTLLVSRQSNPPLEEGTWHLAVAHLRSAMPVAQKRPVKKIPFEIRVSFVRAKAEGVLKPGQPVAGQVRAEEGSVRIYAIDVPESAKALRLDLDGVSSDLDLLARHGQLVVRNEDADETAISPLGRESLVIGAASGRPLQPGRWYVSVVHPMDYGSADFTLHATLAPEPPAAVLAIPSLPLPDDPRRRAIFGTVEVATDLGAASGTLVTEDGLVLTNYHCVADVAENPRESEPVIVAATLDPRQPPCELFRGKVLVFDKKLDLALVQITRGLYRQPLPKGYRFPAIPLGDCAALEIGDMVSTLGFPTVGGSTGRVSVTLTRGVLSGFEQAPIGTLLKTDAAISPGNSGGAALDQHWRMIGVPTYENVDPEFVGRMSYIHPLTLIPEAWRAMLGQRRSAPAASK